MFQAAEMVSATLAVPLDETSLIKAAQGGDQDAFERLVREYDQSVLRIAVNILRSQGVLDYCKNSANPVGHLVLYLCSYSDPERQTWNKELSGGIMRALEGLTPRERTVFELRHYEGLRLRVIGDMIGTTEEAAKNCLFRATQKMRMSLETFV